ncbi:MAG TPA: hypothetical protein VFY89_04360, partial [Ktedonobacterales bacterium]
MASPSAAGGGTSVPSVYHPLPISASNGDVLPSPDGSMLAVRSAPTIALYARDGTKLGVYNPPPGYTASRDLWLPDSSGLLAWSAGSQPGVFSPDVLLSRDGQLHDTGLRGADPAPSPDSAWIAAGIYDSNGHEVGVQIVPRAGGSAATVARGDTIQVLGWLGDRLVYAADSTIMSIPAGGGVAARLGAAPQGPTPAVTGYGYTDSPDGQVVLLSYSHGSAYLVTSSGVSPLPLAVYPALPVYWVGPHSALGQVPGSTRLAVIDLITDAVTQTSTPAPTGQIMAVSGPWILWRAVNADHLELVNFQTGATHELPPPADAVSAVALGGGMFILVVANTG